MHWMQSISADRWNMVRCEWKCRSNDSDELQNENVKWLLTITNFTEPKGVAISQ
jgi:hypothetical protein